MDAMETYKSTRSVHSSVKVVVVLHNVYSSQRVVEAARLVYGLGFTTFIVTKASGSAAQSGVPDAQKLALKRGANFVYLRDLKDAIELFEPGKVLTVSEGKYGGKPLSSVLSELEQADSLMIVFGGAEPGLTMQEFNAGIHVYPDGVEEDIGAVGLIAITLFQVLPHIKS